MFGRPPAPSKGREFERQRTAPTPAQAYVHTSVVLQQLRDEAPKDYVTLGWLLGRLHKRSFGMVTLVLALLATVPGVSIVAGLLLVIPAFQMILGKPAPTFPRWVAARPLPTRYIAALLRRVIPVLGFVEQMIRPRWDTPFEATKRLVGVVVVILSCAIVLAPIPLTSVVPALVIALIALAYLEEDGLLLLIALVAAVGVLAVAGLAVRETVHGANWLRGL
jgi:hypothetical protein